MTLAEIARLVDHSSSAAERYAGSRTVRGGRSDPRDRDWFGRGAAARRLDAALSEAVAQVAALELEAWRDYHGATVASASSLALAAFAHAGEDLDEACWSMRPDGDAERWLVGHAFARAARAARRAARNAIRKVPRSLEVADARERFLHAGLVVRRWFDPRGELGIRMSGHGLETAFGLPGVLVRTSGDEATFLVKVPMPETTRAALVGRPVSALVDHPILRDPALVVTDVDGEGIAPELPFHPDAWRMLVRAPRVPWRLPWARR